MGVNILRDCLGAKPEDSVLCITEEAQMAKLMAKEATSIGANLVSVLLLARPRSRRSLGPHLRAAVQASRIVVAMVSASASEGAFRQELIDAVQSSPGEGTRMALMPGITMDSLSSCVRRTDYALVDERARAIARVLTAGRTAVVTTRAGTDLTMGLGGWQRPADVDNGSITSPHAWDNLPAGEACIAPIEGTASGTLSVDGGFQNHLLSDRKDRITMKVRKGRVDLNSVEGGRTAEELVRLLREFNSRRDSKKSDDSSNVAELGIGVNPQARKVPNILELEKRYGTAHIGLGSNEYLGGRLSSPGHVDLVVLGPSLSVDDFPIQAAGKVNWRQVERLRANQFEAASTQVSRGARIARSKEAGVGEILRGELHRVWRTPGGKLVASLVGSAQVARTAALVWNASSRTPVRVGDLVRAVGGGKRYRSSSSVHKAIGVMIGCGMLDHAT